MQYLVHRGTSGDVSTDAAVVPRPRFHSFETFEGRLLPMQRLFVEVIKSQGVDPPIILDVGVGLGAPTLIDLARELLQAGFKGATIVGIDASEKVLEWTKLIFHQLRKKGEFPSGVEIILEHGDVCRQSEDACSPKSILKKVLPAGRLADICFSSNLILGLPKELAPQAMTSLRDCVSSSGLLVLGAGNACDQLHVEVFRPDSSQHFMSFDVRYGESDTQRADRLRRILEQV